ncbi:MULTISPECIES: DsrE-related protein [Acidianus]|uniref:Sulfur reduction protein DsrE n=1 Tax=Candidatus Acidianus copahuensis TaxID=1160895 RepID=A0A031LN45_9CREN|nr:MULTISPECIES: DsrE-related protein [Acidianus]EZQ07073.1 sulfur reduction protein DsrE [Candidatus Acidianus copahuensis]NON62622.1 sulfur reduction protein DsrE [Acidianus sp. RZ1]
MKRVAYLVESSLGNYILGQMIVPQIEEGRHGVEVVGMFFIDNNVYLLIKGNPLAERLGKLSKEKQIYLQACDQCTYMRDLAGKLIDEAKIGCFPDFYKAVIDKVDLIITI